MISSLFRVITTRRFDLFVIMIGAGLLASPISGCTRAPKTPEIPLPPNNSTHATLASTEPPCNTADNNYQPRWHHMSPQERIKQLKEAQLQAQANKTAYSSHHPSDNDTNKSHTTQPATQPAPTKTSQYTVGAGENLYSIAAKPSIYNDGLLWPLIYKSNRDQIKDPEQIFPGQHLTINHKHSETEKNTARETAKKSGIFIH